ncbi:MAG: hypothetical protein JW929_02475 [Anaerolineales bacterium]|nr:hypothetical protein [Anaerolineales bacterium]
MPDKQLEGFMSSVMLAAIAAGFVLLLFLLAATILWGIRTRRGESSTVPAPKERKKIRADISDPPDLSGSYRQWLDERAEIPAVAAQQPVSARIREEAHAVLKTAGSNVPFGKELESPLQKILCGVMPELSALIEVGKRVQMAAAADAESGSAEERQAILRRVVAEMANRQPENGFLRQVLETLEVERPEAGRGDPRERITVVQIPGRNIVEVDGVEYYSVTDIPDPQLREEARRMVNPPD